MFHIGKRRDSSDPATGRHDRADRDREQPVAARMIRAAPSHPTAARIMIMSAQRLMRGVGLALAYLVAPQRFAMEPRRLPVMRGRGCAVR